MITDDHVPHIHNDPNSSTINENNDHNNSSSSGGEQKIDAASNIFAYEPGVTTSEELQQFLEAFVPLVSPSESSPQQQHQQPLLAAPQIALFARDILHGKYGPKRGQALAEYFQPTLTRVAGKVAQYQDDVARHNDTNSSDNIGGKEGVVVSVVASQLCAAAGMLDILRRFDSGLSNHFKDNQIQLSEWIYGYRILLKGQLFRGLNIKNEAQARQVFQDMAGDNGNEEAIPYDVFCDYIEKIEVEQGTALGQLYANEMLAKSQREKALLEEKRRLLEEKRAAKEAFLQQQRAALEEQKAAREKHQAQTAELQRQREARKEAWATAAAAKLEHLLSIEASETTTTTTDYDSNQVELAVEISDSEHSDNDSTSSSSTTTTTRDVIPEEEEEMQVTDGMSTNLQRVSLEKETSVAENVKTATESESEDPVAKEEMHIRNKAAQVEILVLEAGKLDGLQKVARDARIEEDSNSNSNTARLEEQGTKDSIDEPGEEWMMVQEEEWLEEGKRLVSALDENRKRTAEALADEQRLDTQTSKATVERNELDEPARLTAERGMPAPAEASKLDDENNAAPASPRDPSTNDSTKQSEPSGNRAVGRKLSKAASFAARKRKLEKQILRKKIEEVEQKLLQVRKLMEERTIAEALRLQDEKRIPPTDELENEMKITQDRLVEELEKMEEEAAQLNKESQSSLEADETETENSENVIVEVQLQSGEVEKLDEESSEETKMALVVDMEETLKIPNVQHQLQNEMSGHGESAVMDEGTGIIEAVNLEEQRNSVEASASERKEEILDLEDRKFAEECSLTGNGMAVTARQEQTDIAEIQQPGEERGQAESALLRDAGERITETVNLEEEIRTAEECRLAGNGMAATTLEEQTETAAIQQQGEECGQAESVPRTETGNGIIETVNLEEDISTGTLDGSAQERRREIQEIEDRKGAEERKMDITEIEDQRIIAAVQQPSEESRETNCGVVDEGTKMVEVGNLEETRRTMEASIQRRLGVDSEIEDRKLTEEDVTTFEEETKAVEFQQQNEESGRAAAAALEEGIADCASPDEARNVIDDVDKEGRRIVEIEQELAVDKTPADAMETKKHGEDPIIGEVQQQENQTRQTDTTSLENRTENIVVANVDETRNTVECVEQGERENIVKLEQGLAEDRNLAEKRKMAENSMEQQKQANKQREKKTQPCDIAGTEETEARKTAEAVPHEAYIEDIDQELADNKVSAELEKSAGALRLEASREVAVIVTPDEKRSISRLQPADEMRLAESIVLDVGVRILEVSKLDDKPNTVERSAQVLATEKELSEVKRLSDQGTLAGEPKLGDSVNVSETVMLEKVNIVEVAKPSALEERRRIFEAAHRNQGKGNTAKVAVPERRGNFLQFDVGKRGKSVGEARLGAKTGVAVTTKPEGKVNFTKVQQLENEKSYAKAVGLQERQRIFEASNIKKASNPANYIGQEWRGKTADIARKLPETRKFDEERNRGRSAGLEGRREVGDTAQAEGKANSAEVRQPGEESPPQKGNNIKVEVTLTAEQEIKESDKNEVRRTIPSPTDGAKYAVPEEKLLPEIENGKMRRQEKGTSAASEPKESTPWNLKKAKTRQKEGKMTNAAGITLRKTMFPTTSLADDPDPHKTYELGLFLKAFKPCLEDASTLSGAFVDEICNPIRTFAFDKLKRAVGRSEGTRIAEMFVPAINKTFSKLSSESNQNCITALVAAHLCVYARMLDTLRRLDGGRSNESVQIYFHEWIYGYRSLAFGTRFTALIKLETEAHATEAFATMTSEKGHDKYIVEYPEWCAYLEKAEVEAGTQLGELFDDSIAIRMQARSNATEEAETLEADFLADNMIADRWLSTETFKAEQSIHVESTNQIDPLCLATFEVGQWQTTMNSASLDDENRGMVEDEQSTAFTSHDFITIPSRDYGKMANRPVSRESLDVEMSVQGDGCNQVDPSCLGTAACMDSEKESMVDHGSPNHISGDDSVPIPRPEDAMITGRPLSSETDVKQSSPCETSTQFDPPCLATSVQDAALLTTMESASWDEPNAQKTDESPTPATSIDDGAVPEPNDGSVAVDLPVSRESPIVEGVSQKSSAELSSCASQVDGKKSHCISAEEEDLSSTSQMTSAASTIRESCDTDHVAPSKSKPSTAMDVKLTSVCESIPLTSACESTKEISPIEGVGALFQNVATFGISQQAQVGCSKDAGHESATGLQVQTEKKEIPCTGGELNINLVEDTAERSNKCDRSTTGISPSPVELVSEASSKATKDRPTDVNPCNAKSETSKRRNRRPVEPDAFDVTSVEIPYAKINTNAAHRCGVVDTEEQSAISEMTSLDGREGKRTPLPKTQEGRDVTNESGLGQRPYNEDARRLKPVKEVESTTLTQASSDDHKSANLEKDRQGVAVATSEAENNGPSSKSLNPRDKRDDRQQLGKVSAPNVASLGLLGGSDRLPEIELNVSGVETKSKSKSMARKDRMVVPKVIHTGSMKVDGVSNVAQSPFSDGSKGSTSSPAQQARARTPLKQKDSKKSTEAIDSQKNSSIRADGPSAAPNSSLKPERPITGKQKTGSATEDIMQKAIEEGRSRAEAEEMQRQVKIFGRVSCDPVPPCEPLKPTLGRPSSEHVSEVSSSALFKNATARQDLEYVIDGMELPFDHATHLRTMYRDFRSAYEYAVFRGCPSMLPGSHDGDRRAALLSTAKRIAQDKESTFDAQVSALTAQIFAYWSLETECEKQDGKTLKTTREVREPHPVQVTAVWCMLNCVGRRESHLQNHLVEVKTGEGKSIVLGVTATVLALLGYRVECVCYSSYLSGRDYDSFRRLFTFFGVAGRIRYGTVNELCDRMLEENGSIRELAGNTIKGRVVDPTHDELSPDCRRVLLIDEADVFFKEDFFGKTYTPMLQLRCDKSSRLIRFIWENYESLDIDKLVQSAEGRELLASFPADTHAMIKNFFVEMLRDARRVGQNLETEYVVSDGQIKYKYMDGLRGKHCVGYETTFIYMKELQRRRVTDDEAKSEQGLNFRCGKVSYAELPLTFHAIVGVTGTLKGLSASELEILRDIYQIERLTFLPSAFGRNSLAFAGDSERDVLLCDTKKDHFFEIRNEIDHRRVAFTNGTPIQRAVLVFFDKATTLLEFYNSSYMEPLKSVTTCVTESTKVPEREAAFSKATQQGAITLMTRQYGRGIDYQCHDPILLHAGGVHVIQAFLSMDISEEIQIKGRCARQGAKGSFSMVLDAGQLKQQLNITNEDIETMRRTRVLHTFLDRKRTEIQRTRQRKVTAKIQKLKELHHRTLECKEMMLCGKKKRKEVLAFLTEMNGCGCRPVSSSSSAPSVLPPKSGSKLHENISQHKQQQRANSSSAGVASESMSRVRGNYEISNHNPNTNTPLTVNRRARSSSPCLVRQSGSIPQQQQLQRHQQTQTSKLFPPRASSPVVVRRTTPSMNMSRSISPMLQHQQHHPQQQQHHHQQHPPSSVIPRSASNQNNTAWQEQRPPPSRMIGFVTRSASPSSASMERERERPISTILRSSSPVMVPRQRAPSPDMVRQLRINRIESSTPTRRRPNL